MILLVYHPRTSRHTRQYKETTVAQLCQYGNEHESSWDLFRACSHMLRVYCSEWLFPFSLLCTLSGAATSSLTRHPKNPVRYSVLIRTRKASCLHILQRCSHLKELSTYLFTPIKKLTAQRLEKEMKIKSLPKTRRYIWNSAFMWKMSKLTKMVYQAIFQLTADAGSTTL